MQKIHCYMSSTHMPCKKDWMECVRWVQRVGFTGLELFQGENGVNFLDLPEEYCLAIGDLARELNIVLSAHPWMACDQLPEDQMIERFLFMVRRCARMGVREINMHPQFLSDRRQGMSRVFAATDAALPLLQETGMVLYYENVPDHGIRELGSEVGDFAALFARYGEDAPVLLNIDVGHAHIMHQLQPLAEDFASRWQYTHINDNDGLGDLHVAPGEGTLNFELLSQLSAENGYTGPLMMEYNYKGLHRGMEELERTYSAQGFTWAPLHLERG